MSEAKELLFGGVRQHGKMGLFVQQVARSLCNNGEVAIPATSASHARSLQRLLNRYGFNKLGVTFSVIKDEPVRSTDRPRFCLLIKSKLKEEPKP